MFPSHCKVFEKSLGALLIIMLLIEWDVARIIPTNLELHFSQTHYLRAAGGRVGFTG